MFLLRHNFFISSLVWLFLLSACGPSAQPLVDLNDRLVPVDSASSLQNSEVVDEAAADSERELATEFPADVPLVGLSDKILANSTVPKKALENAFNFYNKNQSIIRNKKYLTIFDISQHSGQRRLYLIDLNTGEVKSMHVAHGNGSDTNNDGVATQFSNTSGSKMSSLGYMLTAETYIGKHGESLRLDGLESRNSRVRSRAIVIHSATYVNADLSKMGRSEGCPAVSLATIKDLIAKVKNGSLYYIYHGAYD